MNERKIQKALKRFCENPYWKEYYETAPTVACKEYIGLKFYYSEFPGQIPNYDEFKKECENLEKRFVKEDWVHLYRHCANNPRKVYYKNKINEYL